jgi:uncharacterized protein YyaL (SSP411 family)
MDKNTNDLIRESSPYLLQHAHNPVNWYPWSETALKKAADENKMLIISIGYSACHWCHVMAHESFEDEIVAGIMNEHFVSIKVDREERPDIDKLYMNTAYLLGISGGWPFNVFALPDGKPFYAGTYFSKSNWIKVLNYLVDVRQKNPSSISAQADEIVQGIRSIESISPVNGTSVLSASDLKDIFINIESFTDREKGGTRHAPKFPMPSIWEYVMQYYALSRNPEALTALSSTLDNMSRGGIYDQIGGGFSRYSTDEDWHIPHFEKMLYDNAQLVSLYSHAWQLTKDPSYKEVVCKTLDFIRCEMTSPEGGFFSSLDADSEGEEGKYYCWTKKEIVSVLGNTAQLFLDYYDVSESGNWEKGKNVLHVRRSENEILKKHNMSHPGLKEALAHCADLLLKEREKRKRPGTDDKILTSWNALMLKGYADAYRAFGDDSYLKAAIGNANFLVKNSISLKNGITRNYKNGISYGPGLLDDYSFTISAFIGLYQATFEENWLNTALRIAEYTILHFFDASSGMFYFSSDEHSDLIERTMEVTDNVIPASNSEMAINLYLLGHYYSNESFIQKVKQMMMNVHDNVIKNIYSYSNWGRLGILLHRPLCEVAIIGPEWEERRRTMDRNYLPNAIFLGGESEGTLNLLAGKLVPHQTTIYVCMDKTCRNPVTDTGEALSQINEQFSI